MYLETPKLNAAAWDDVSVLTLPQLQFNTGLKIVPTSHKHGYFIGFCLIHWLVDRKVIVQAPAPPHWGLNPVGPLRKVLNPFFPSTLTPTSSAGIC